MSRSKEIKDSIVDDVILALKDSFVLVVISTIILESFKADHAQLHTDITEKGRSWIVFERKRTS